MYIYVIRHGQTNWNIEHKLLSITDIGLNEKGIEQCKEASKIVKELNFDIVLCSPLLRTRQTAEIVNINNVPVVFEEALIERNSGSFEGVNTETDTSFNYKDFWTLGKGIQKDEETIEACKARVYNLLDSLKSKYKGKNILIVTHNGICRIINTYFNGFPKRGDIYNKGQDNAEIKIYEIK